MFANDIDEDQTGNISRVGQRMLPDDAAAEGVADKHERPAFSACGQRLA
jgi:hypothetical protein